MYSALLLNGGVGKRFGAEAPKQFTRVNGLPIVVYSLLAIDRVEAIDEIVLNYPPGWRDSLEKIVRDYAVGTAVRYVEAGESRHESVARMLPLARNEHVILHESARPLVGTDDFQAIIDEPAVNVTYALDIPFTVAPVDPGTGLVTGSLERDRLRNVQLPQKYALADLAHAHAYARERGLVFTEDATLCTVAGHEVAFLAGRDRNIKITKLQDLHLANHLLRDVEEVDE